MRLLPERSEVFPILVRLGGFTGLFVLVLVLVALPLGLPGSLAALGSLQLLAAIAASTVVLRMDGRRSLSAIGLARAGSGRGLGLGLLLGIALVVPALAVAMGAGGLRYALEGGTWIEYLATGGWTCLILLLAAAGEEIGVRGYPLRVLVERWGPWPALVLTSVAFSVLHGANPNVGGLALLNIVLAGALLGVVCLRTGDLWWATGVHAGWNLGTGFAADLPVSGITLVDAPVFEVAGGGAALWTGGDFGLEGGLAATVALVLGIPVVARTSILPSRWLRGPTAPTEETG